MMLDLTTTWKLMEDEFDKALLSHESNSYKHKNLETSSIEETIQLMQKSIDELYETVNDLQKEMNELKSSK